MKKLLLCAALLSTVGVAHAQSSITLYGVIDAGLTYINNQGGGRLIEFQDGANFGNRFGLKGSEDLGGGMKAIFQLENGFSLGTGALRNGGALFGRQSFVGLSTPYGTITGGNQYDFVADYINPYNLNGYASVYAGHMGNFDRIAANEITNSVKFKSVDYNGFTFGGMYGFGNVAGNFNENSAWSVGMGYKHGGFNMAAVYQRLYNVQIDPYAQIGVTTFLGQTVATRNADGTVTDLYAGPYFTVDRQSETAVGASYSVGALTMAANFTSTNLRYGADSATMNVYEAGAMYFIKPDIAVIGGYQYTTYDGAHWHQPTLGAQYYVSRRTNFYVNVSYLRASAGVDANQGAGFYSLPSSTRTQITSRIAMIHTF
ncbi:porin [Paraburkholderia sp.]|uniref:porin n=1 Tax=Paraburkholderia sp. TaxID=1926495 RepID=UPI002387E044|nr:porin [Paraburkholderia sp.]MDE1180020.1 porin [Paraburkholderia sp.]